jgi:hypothetical protein
MSRSVLSVALVTALLAAQPACNTLSKNNHMGIQYVGGAAAIIGVIMLADSASCDERSGGEKACNESGDEVVYGAGMLGLGVGLILASRYLLKPASAAQ